MQETTLTFMPHYKVMKLNNLDEVKDIFKKGADKLNWLFANTGGVHSGSGTLDEVEEELRKDTNYKDKHFVTLLVVHPRLCVLKYGEIEVKTVDDILWLRSTISNTLYAVKESQERNVWFELPGGDI